MMSFNGFRKITFYITAIITGIMICAAALSLSLKAIQFNSGYQKQLFVKNDIYSHVQNIVESSMSDLTGSLENSQQESDKSKQILNIVKDISSKEIIGKNLDLLRNGLFEYFRGEKQLLPDLYLPDKSLSPQSGSTESFGKVNLNAILGIMNRQDISNSLSYIRFMYFIIENIPEAALVILVLMLYIGVIICNNAKELLHWAKATFMACGVSCIFIGIMFIFLNYITIPSKLSALILSLPLPRETVFSYITDCLMPAVIILLIASVTSLLLFKYSINIHEYFSKTKHYEKIKNKIKKTHISKPFKITTYSLLGILLIGLTASGLTNIRKEFKENNFTEVLANLKNVSTSTKVIAAMNDSIYTLQIELMDRETNAPLQNVAFMVKGVSENIMQSSVTNSSITDTDGHAKLTMDRGSYFLSFDSIDFPKAYKIPSPIYFELKEPGTTIITIMLEPQTKNTTEQYISIR